MSIKFPEEPILMKDEQVKHRPKRRTISLWRIKDVMHDVLQFWRDLI